MKKNQKILIVLFLLVLSFNSQAAESWYRSCIVYPFEGESFECEGYTLGKKFIYRINPNEKPTKINASNFQFVVEIVSDTTVIIRSAMPYITLKNSANGNFKKPKKDYWFTFLTSPFNNKVSIFQVNYTDMVVYGCYKQGDDYGVELLKYSLWGYKIPFERSSKYYFNDCPDILEYIKNTTINSKFDFLLNIVEEYNKCLENK